MRIAYGEVGSKQRPYHIAKCLGFNHNVLGSSFEGFGQRGSLNQLYIFEMLWQRS